MFSSSSSSSYRSPFPPSSSSSSPDHHDGQEEKIHYKNAESLLNSLSGIEKHPKRKASKISNVGDNNAHEDLLYDSSTPEQPQEAQMPVKSKGSKRHRKLEVEWKEDRHNVFVSIQELPDSSTESVLYHMLVKHCPKDVWINRLQLKHMIIAAEEKGPELEKKWDPFFQHIKRDVREKIRHKIIEETEYATEPGMVMCFNSLRGGFVRINNVSR